VLGGATSILGAQPLINKVYFPRELIVFATVLSLLVTLAIELTVCNGLLLAFGYLRPAVHALAPRHHGHPDPVPDRALALAAASVRSRDVPYLIGLTLTVWFFITPIVWSERALHNGQAVFGFTVPLRSILLANPMARFTIAYRRMLYDGAPPGLKTLAGLRAGRPARCHRPVPPGPAHRGAEPGVCGAPPSSCWWRSTLFGKLPLPLGVAGHEGSTIVVGLNGLRLLRASAWDVTGARPPRRRAGRLARRTSPHRRPSPSATSCS